MKKVDLEKATQALVAKLNGLTFDADEGNAGYVRKITPLVRSALREAAGQTAPDWRKILVAYIAHVTDAESVNYLHSWGTERLSPAENAALFRAAADAEVDCPKHKADLIGWAEELEREGK